MPVQKKQQWERTVEKHGVNWISKLGILVLEYDKGYYQQNRAKVYRVHYPYAGTTEFFEVTEFPLEPDRKPTVYRLTKKEVKELERDFNRLLL